MFEVNYFKLLFLIISLFAYASITLCASIDTNENHVKEYLANGNIRIFRAFQEFQDYQFQTDIEDQDEIFKRLVNAMKTVVDVASYVKQYPYNDFHDEELKREIRSLINSCGVFILNNDDLMSLYASQERLRKLATLKSVCPYKKMSVQSCNLSYIPDIQNIITESHDPNELQYYWNAYREISTRNAQYDFENVIEKYKKAAELNGQNPLELWYKDYEDIDFLQDLEDVMKQLEPFYKEMHAYIRNVLFNKYGSLILSNNGPIPQHLIEQVLVQAWNPNSVLEHPYPNKKLPQFSHKLERERFSARKVIERADHFFRSLGLPELLPKFWTDHMKVKSEEGFLEECKATVYDYIPDGALKYCPQTNFKKFLQMHGYMAQLHYINNARHLPYAFYDSFNFEHGVGEAAILSASSPKHIKRIGLLPNYEYDDESSMNRIFRLAIHTMLNLPVHFVQSKILAEILSGRVDVKHHNVYYWKLMERYAGIEPPVNRNASDFDFSYKFYEDLTENHQTRKFVGEILGYQFYRAFCEISGQFVRYDKNHPLQNCDFYGSVQAGNVLKQMMSLGSSRPWRQVLGRVLGADADLNGAALLDFFEPIKLWLEEQNRINNVQVGWEKSKKIINYSL